MICWDVLIKDVWKNPRISVHITWTNIYFIPLFMMSDLFNKFSSCNSWSGSYLHVWEDFMVHSTLSWLQKSLICQKYWHWSSTEVSTNQETVYSICSNDSHPWVLWHLLLSNCCDTFGKLLNMLSYIICPHFLHFVCWWGQLFQYICYHLSFLFVLS